MGTWAALLAAVLQDSRGHLVLLSAVRYQVRFVKVWTSIHSSSNYRG